MAGMMDTMLVVSFEKKMVAFLYFWNSM